MNPYPYPQYRQQQQQLHQQAQPQQFQMGYVAPRQMNQDVALVPQTSTHYDSGTDTSNSGSLQIQLLKEKSLREKTEKELEQQKRIATDLTNKLQCSYFMMLQMQEALRLNCYSHALALENTQLKEKVEQLVKEKTELEEKLQEEQVRHDKLEIECDEKGEDGFDTNEIYCTKNELLLMALNYDMTTRHSPSSS